MKVASSQPVDDLGYYVSHHGIFRAGSRKIWVVFNASQKASSEYSLKDLLLPGRKLQPDITLIFSWWRFSRVAIVTDIVKMFRQFLVHVDYLDWQRLVWRNSITAPIPDFVALIVTYGTTCAPYLAMKAMLQLVKDGQNSHPMVHLVIKSNLCWWYFPRSGRRGSSQETSRSTHRSLGYSRDAAWEMVEQLLRASPRTARRRRAWSPLSL